MSEKTEHKNSKHIPSEAILWSFWLTESKLYQLHLSKYLFVSHLFSTFLLYCCYTVTQRSQIWYELLWMLSMTINISQHISYGRVMSPGFIHISAREWVTEDKCDAILRSVFCRNNEVILKTKELGKTYNRQSYGHVICWSTDHLIFIHEHVVHGNSDL